MVGGGIAGTCAAVSAARLGLQVALIQNRPVLGGNNSSEVRVHLNGEINKPPYSAVGGIIEIDFTEDFRVCCTSELPGTSTTSGSRAEAVEDGRVI
ncbi:MAG: FAD-dependent oxidoreductase [Phycisphaerales bacterium]|nr:MAG: FAD-dependent oxidoreductase [Phycisphaerales bacterium]